ncbi:hypothetical protein L195_g008681 [Trifolium pratense]|uniref:Uncharacterized protein n=1 Tax=Trifolium pratense TaxID=57577 RepID=A0A2K3P9V3_TRIPR|nr:hypothetical protein L195_g008681 [Trifolium pratense]
MRTGDGCGGEQRDGGNGVVAMMDGVTAADDGRVVVAAKR